MNQQKLSVVIPVYNESGVIEGVVRSFYEKVIKKNPGAALIIAEDGSTDGTKELLERIKKDIPFTLISGKNRKGYARAFKDALAMAKTDLVFFSDSDGQHDPDDFYKLLKEIDHYDIVGGYKAPRRDPLHRSVISAGYNLFIWLLFGLKMRDIDAGFKLIRKEVIDSVLKNVTSLKYCVMSEFIIRAYMAGYRIKEVPIVHYPRKTGATTIFHPAKLPGIIFDIFVKILGIRRKMSRRKYR